VPFWRSAMRSASSTSRLSSTVYPSLARMSRVRARRLTGFGVRGHIPERDGILVGLLFADMIVKAGKTLSMILADLEPRVGPHAYARHYIHLVRETYDADRKRILDTLEKNEPEEVAGIPVQRVRADDGFKFYLADGSWVLLRASGTEPLIRIYSEAADSAGVEARLAALEDIVGLRSTG
jgi:phosphomannomutase